jgi:hypothetical protein
LFAVGGRNAWSVVFHPQLELPAHDSGAQPDMAIARGVFEGVVDQVRNHSLNRSSIHFDLGQIAWNVNFDSSAVEQTAHSVEPSVDKCLRSGGNLAGMFCPSLVPGGRVIHQIFDEFGESVRFVFDLSQEVVAGLVIPVDVSSAQGAHESFDVAQR